MGGADVRHVDIARVAARRGVVVACACLVLVSLTACAGSEQHAAASSVSRQQADSPSPDDTSEVSPSDVPDFEESVSAEMERVRESAEAFLEKADGRGNAMRDVSIRGIPTRHTGGFRAGLVTVKNSTDKTAFYSIKVEFIRDDRTLDTVILGIEDVKPGEKVQRHAMSRKAYAEKGRPTITKAQRD